MSGGLPRSRRGCGARAFCLSGKTSNLTEFISGRLVKSGVPMRLAAWGSKPGYEDRKAALEAKLNK